MLRPAQGTPRPHPGLERRPRGSPDPPSAGTPRCCGPGSHRLGHAKDRCRLSTADTRTAGASGGSSGRLRYAAAPENQARQIFLRVVPAKASRPVHNKAIEAGSGAIPEVGSASGEGRVPGDTVEDE